MWIFFLIYIFMVVDKKPNLSALLGVRVKKIDKNTSNNKPWLG